VNGDVEFVANRDDRGALRRGKASDDAGAGRCRSLLIERWDDDRGSDDREHEQRPHLIDASARPLSHLACRNETDVAEPSLDVPTRSGGTVRRGRCGPPAAGATTANDPHNDKCRDEDDER
jgi:hypothetical protein